MNFRNLNALEVAKKIKDRELSAVGVTKAQIEHIKINNNKYNSFISILEDEGLNRAQKVQQQIDNGEFESSPLAGVPIGIKDNICSQNIRTTAASKMLIDFVPSYNATVIEKLEDAGAIIIGKLNMDEFAMGSSSETSYFGPSKNPRNDQYVPGGSSGGSASSVAGNEVFYSLGTDTGGSIRQPCSLCGITGIKPTYGTVSRYGLIAFASSLDQIGPMAKDVADATAVLDIIKGYDPKDSTSIKMEYGSYSEALIDDVKGMKIGVPKDLLEASMNEQVKEKFNEAIRVFEDKGAIIEYIDLSTIDYVIPTYKILSSAEASSSLSRFDGIRYGYRSEEANNLEEVYRKSRGEAFGNEVKLRILLGTYVLNSENHDDYYSKALKIRRLINLEFDQVFSKYDIIISPTTLYTAFKLKEFDNDNVNKYSETDSKYTIAANLVGAPAISLPCGLDASGLPIGLQIIGRRFGEKDIIRAAYSYEQSQK